MNMQSELHPTDAKARRDARAGQTGGTYATHTDDGLDLCPKCGKLAVVPAKAQECLDCSGKAGKAAWLYADDADPLAKKTPKTIYQIWREVLDRNTTE
jgi:hypothetical protein